MIAYFIQVSCCWLVFHLIYRIFLRKETFFSTNRMYLIGTLCLGLILPLLRLLALELIQTPESVKVYIAPIAMGMTVVEQVTQPSSYTNNYQWTDYLIGIYLIGVLILLVKFVVGLYQIYRLYKTGTLEQISGLRLVRTNKAHLPFSFWNIIFWSKEVELSASDFKKIIQHEEGHIRERHTIDVLLIELISMVFWCSPPIWLYKKSLKEVHEYLADAYVLTTTATKQYGHLLLRQVQPGLQVALANHFFQSQLKNRISMMTKTKSSKWRRWKYGIGMSAVALLLMAFSMQVTTFKELVERTGKTSFNWRISELLGSNFDEVKVRNVLEQKFKDQNRAYFVDKEGNKTEPVGDNFHTSTQIAQLHGVYRDILHIYPDHHNEINEIATQLFYDYGLNARIEKNTIIYTNENEVDEEKPPFESNTKFIKQLQKGSDSMIFYDGKRFDGTSADLNEKKISYFAGLTKAEALQKYGESGEDGAVEVFSKTEQQVNEKEIEKPIVESSFPHVNEESARFPGCEEIKNRSDREECSKQALLEFIYTNIKYPEATQSIGLEGMVVVRLVIDEDGSIINSEIVRRLDEYTSIEVLRIIKLMPKWIPGKLNGREIKTTYTVPVKFKLESKPEVFGESKNNEKELFTTTEEMPRFPGCETIENKADREECSKSELLQFVYENIEYPKATQDAGLEGMVVVKFSVDTDGTVLDPSIVRSIDKYTDEEVLKMVRAMPSWIPGKQYGKAVRVQYNLPVKFKLADDDLSKKDKNVPSNTLKTEHFKVFPNPVTDVLNIELKTTSDEKTTIEITDSSGKRWISSTQTNTDKMTNTTFDVSQLPAGMYFLTVTQGDQKVSESFIKE